MAKGKTNIIGLTTQWRTGKSHDALRIFVYKNEYISISSKIHPTLKEINKYLKKNKLREKEANLDQHFQILLQRLKSELKSQYGLRSYRAQENLDLIKKSFNFKISLNDFESYKSDTSCAHKYKVIVEKFWFPFFIQDKQCEHPNEFIQYRKQCVTHVKTALNKHGEKYSVHSYNELTKALNQYMKFLLDYEIISSDKFFRLFISLTLEQKKRGLAKPKRSQDTYSEIELVGIKNTIDKKYCNNQKMKLRAYALYFGVCIGQRRGNFLGLRAKNLNPTDNIPNFQITDNIVSGWSRGIKGSHIMKNCTKTAYLGDNNKPTLIPLLLPSKEILVEVAQYLKNNIKPEDRLLYCSPSSVGKFWRKIAQDCDFKYLSPHQWKHSYATIGTLHFHDWYKGNIYNLQVCCQHEDIRMTMKYVNQKSDEFLKAFE